LVGRKARRVDAALRFLERKGDQGEEDYSVSWIGGGALELEKGGTKKNHKQMDRERTSHENRWRGGKGKDLAAMRRERGPRARIGDWRKKKN